MWKGYIVDCRYAIAEDVQIKLVENFEKIGLEVERRHYAADDEIIKNCQDADVLLCIGNPPITRKVAENMPKLKYVQRLGIGVNSLDLDALRENGILALNLPGVSATELSLHTTALVLDLMKHISYYDRNIRMGSYLKGKGKPYPPFSQMTIGFFGFGTTSKMLYRIFKSGFGAKRIIAYDPYITRESIDEYDISLVNFDGLLSQSDILSIHAHLNSETFHIFNYEAFKKMKREALFINISRGGIVSQDDLIQALEEGLIGGAGLDVFEQEPLPASCPLTKMDNVVMTPHSAFLGQEADRKRDEWVVDIARQIIQENRVPEKMIANKGVVPRIKDIAVV